MGGLLMIRVLTIAALLTSLLSLGASATQPTESFVVGSVWSGTEMGDPRRPHTPQARSRPAKLTVVDRKDAVFSGDYSVGTNAVHLEGKVDAHGRLIAHATRVIKGGDWGPKVLEIIWNGNVAGDQLTIEYTLANNLTQTVQLSLDSGSESSGRKHKNK